MAKHVSVLLVTSEVYPFLKTSELADLCYAHALGSREVGHDIRVMMPKYGFISERKNRIHDINRLKDMPIAVGKTESLATVKSSSINNPRVKVQAYITTNTNYLDANKGLLVDNATGKPFKDNDERFIFFNRSVIETCLLLGWFPDIIHCVGWQAGLLPAYIKTMWPEEFKKTKVIMTITNFNDQGTFGLKSLPKTGLPEKVAAKAKYKNKMNLLRLGIAHADMVTTLSPGYAKEIENLKEWKDNWRSIMPKGDKKIHGAPHGIDLMQWNPKTDSFLRSKYDANNLAPKQRVREQLQRAAGLSVDGRAIVASYIGPLDDDHGIDILGKAIPAIVKAGAQVVIATDVPTDHKKTLDAIVKKFPGKVSLKVGVDEEFVHNAIAGSTLLLKPSRNEAAGQFQRCAVRYGTIPVVRITGGIAEQLEDVNEKQRTGNAFLFKRNDAKDLAKAVERAVKLHGEHEAWSAIVQNAMSTDVSWSLSAQPYDELYRNLVKDSK
jgi:starch synthase